MSKKLRTEAVDHLFDAILSLQNREECYTFFEDVCTVKLFLRMSVLSMSYSLCRSALRSQRCFVNRKPIWILLKKPVRLRQRSAV